MLFVVGIFEGPSAPGTGIVGVAVAACAYGFGAALYGAPSAILGGCVGAFVWRSSPAEEYEVELLCERCEKRAKPSASGVVLCDDCRGLVYRCCQCHDMVLIVQADT
ncbi:MAG TPA: hypothetical protein VGM98_18780, partial [Schlesneria sp.]